MVSLKLSPQTRHVLFVIFFFSLLFILFFSPVLFSGQLLAPGEGRLGDGVVYHLTFFESSKLLWDNLLINGFPMTADPQVMAWYPPALLLSFIPGAWNAFVVSAYVMAGCFTYGYVYAITRSRWSATVSGIIYAMCGFMVAHMGHTAMIHSAVWLPLIVWSLEMLRREFSRFWFTVGCLAVLCCILAGHLQIVAYSLIVSLAYALFRGWLAPMRRQFYLFAALLFAIGFGLAALQILPAKELASQSMRTHFAFQDFVSFSFPFKHIPSLFFPAVFGGLPNYGKTPYFGEWNFIELTGYLGLLPLMLGIIGFIAWRRKGVAVFWLTIGIVTFFLALGERTPLALLIYQLPVLSQFRAPARHVVEVGFAVSVLAGLGVQAIANKKVSRRLVVISIALVAMGMATGLAMLWSHKVHQLALERGAADFTVTPWSNPAIGVPLAIFVVATAALFIWHRNPESVLRRSLVVLVLLLDLGSFAWFLSWHFDAPGKNVVHEPASSLRIKELLSDSNQRMLSIRGNLGTADELIPNISRLWNVPNATGYGPLLPSRVMYLLSMLPDGSIASTWKNPEDQSLNLTSVRYVLLPRISPRPGNGIVWPDENLDIWLGSGCVRPPRNSAQFSLPSPVPANSVNIVSRLACAVAIKEGQEVARLLVTDVDGNVEQQGILAGRDSSEWSYDCASIKPNMAHQRAVVFSTFPAKMYDEPCEGHVYLAQFKLQNAKPISRIEIQSTLNSGAFVIEKINLLDESTKTSESINSVSALSETWRFVDTVGSAQIYENTRALPRAWLVSEPINLGPEDALRTIKTSRMPDGREFDPARMALVEKDLRSNTADPGASAKIIRLADTVIEVQTSSTNLGFLVTSDVYYPGWEVTVDGAIAELYRTNYAFRGVQVPAGAHNVRFEFRPRTFYLGLTISALSLLALVLLIVFSRKFNEISAHAESLSNRRTEPI